MTGVLATGFAQEERRREYLRVWEQVARVPLFASLGVVTLSEIVGKLRTRYYPPRITVVRRGDAGDSMFFISSGEVEVRLPNGGSVRLGEGAFFGEMALLERQPRSATVATTRPTTLLVLYASDFYEIASHIPKLAEAVEDRGQAAARGEPRDARRPAADDKAPFRGHWPGPPLRLYRASSRGLASARPPSNESPRCHPSRPSSWLEAPASACGPCRARACPSSSCRCSASSRPSSRRCCASPTAACSARPVIATNDAYRFMAEQQAKEIGIEIDILVEPSRRDSGPAMAAAAAYCPEPGRQGGAGAGLGPSGDRRRGVPRRLPRGAAPPSSRAASSPSASRRPSPRPTTATSGRAASISAPVQKVAAFVEKPNAQTALRYISEGLLWNSGNFLFPPELLLSEMARFEPAMAAAAEEAVAKAKKTGSTVFLDAEAFAKAPAKSIDYAVMERTDKCWVVPAKFRWSDLGTWDALLDVGEADSAGNVTEGPVEIDHVRNSYVRSDGPLTAVIGVEDVVVVAMNDAVLVGHRDNLPRLKDVVQRMSDGKHRAATEHAVMHRPWGSYQDIDRGERFRAKRLTVNPKRQAQPAEPQAPRRALGRGQGRRPRSRSTARS